MTAATSAHGVQWAGSLLPGLCVSNLLAEQLTVPIAAGDIFRSPVVRALLCYSPLILRWLKELLGGQDL
jgi:hypothetical protein